MRQYLNDEQFARFSLINIDEMNQFICIIICMGRGDLPTYEMYWKKSGNPWHNDFCGKLLKLERFSKIKRYFHVFTMMFTKILIHGRLKFPNLTD